MAVQAIELFNWRVGTAQQEQLQSPENVRVFNQKTVEDCLSHLRDERTHVPEFKKNADTIALLLGAYLAESQPVTLRPIRTPCGDTEGRFIDTADTLLVAVLRSGFPLCRGIQAAMPGSRIALVDIKRDEITAQPSLNYDGLPASLEGYRRVIIPDPMLATGGSALMTIAMLNERGADDSQIELTAIVSAPEGIARIQQQHPLIPITTCAVDEGLNSTKYIVPGLGDFGDRYFGDSHVNIPDVLNNQILFYQENKFTIQRVS
jgi:uracil phosphoribosyltransferase